MSTYSFLNVNVTMVGPGGVINLGAGAANAKTGISVEAAEDIGHMDVGADGVVQHSLHANQSGTCSVRLQKTSPINAQLQTMYNFQTSSSANYGQNTISLNNPATGDKVILQNVGFKRAVALTYAEDAGMNEWQFNVGSITRILGAD